MLVIATRPLAFERKPPRVFVFVAALARGEQSSEGLGRAVVVVATASRQQPPRRIHLCRLYVEARRNNDHREETTSCGHFESTRYRLRFEVGALMAQVGAQWRFWSPPS